MTISLSISDTDVPAWQYRVDQFDAGSGQPPTDIATFIQKQLDIESSRLVAAKDAVNKQALAANERLVALGKAVAAQPDKLDAVESAVSAILNS